MLELVFDETFGSVPLYIDNMSALHVASNRTYSPRAKSKNEVCSAGGSTNRCLLKPIELPEAFWFEPIFQGLGEYKAQSLKRSFVVHCLGEFT